MGFFSKLLKASNSAKEGIHSVASEWKKILNRNPNMDSFEIAKLVISSRPEQYYQSYLMALELQEMTNQSSKGRLIEYLFGITQFIWLFLLIEYDIEKHEIDEKAKNQWTLTINNKLNLVGLQESPGSKTNTPSK